MEIIFHIGAGKTGTSAIQHALAANRSVLEKQGIYVPTDDLTNSGKCTGYQVWWFESIKKLGFEDALEKLKKGMSTVIEAAENNGCNRVLFSAENLCNTFNWSELFKEALNGYEVDVCIYIRRQDEYLLSSWQQWGIKGGVSLEDWLYKSLGIVGDWSIPIKEWQQIATSKLKVGIYQRDRLENGDVVDDVMRRIGVDPKSITKTKSNVNTSYNIAVEDLVLATPSLFEGPHDNEFYNMIRKYCNLAQRKNSRDSRLSGAERRSILNRYQESNQWIAHEYFSDSEDAIFSVPQDSDYHVLSRSEIDDKKWALLVELVYGMHKQNN